MKQTPSRLWTVPGQSNESDEKYRKKRRLGRQAAQQTRRGEEGRVGLSKNGAVIRW
jgi:hypothetical protein